MNCSNCDQPLQPGERYCSNCGTPAPRPASPPSSQPAQGGRIGAIVGERIGTINFGKQGDQPDAVECPICGSVNPPQRTFRCKSCGRQGLCRKHQDAASYRCEECIEPQRGPGQPPEPPAVELFGINYQFVYPFLPMKSETLAQVLVSFTCAEDAALVGPSPTSHLCMVLDVSGSMNTTDKYPLLREAIPHLIDALSDDDYLTIVVFSMGCDVVLSEQVGRCRGQIKAILDRVDHSGVMFGRRTLLAPGLRTALDHIERRRSELPGIVDRLYILTDGDLHDPDECYLLNPRLRSLEAELHSYGFGQDFALETMKRIMAGVPGGTVKPIFNTQDVQATFSHIGELAERIVAQEAELTFTFARDVVAGDAFRYHPGSEYFGSVDNRSKTISLKLGALERERVYTFLFEGQLRPSSQNRQEVGVAALRYRHSGRLEKIERRILASRTNDSWQASRPDEEAFQVFQVLDALRKTDPQTQIKALRARLAIYRREKADPVLVELIEQSIAKLEHGDALTDVARRRLRADKVTSNSDELPDDLRGRAVDWLQKGISPPRIQWLLKIATKIENEGLVLVLNGLSSPECKVLATILSEGDPLVVLSASDLQAFDAALG